MSCSYDYRRCYCYYHHEEVLHGNHIVLEAISDFRHSFICSSPPTDPSSVGGNWWSANFFGIDDSFMDPEKLHSYSSWWHSNPLHWSGDFSVFYLRLRPATPDLDSSKSNFQTIFLNSVFLTFRINGGKVAIRTWSGNIWTGNSAAVGYKRSIPEKPSKVFFFCQFAVFQFILLYNLEHIANGWSHIIPNSWVTAKFCH